MYSRCLSGFWAFHLRLYARRASIAAGVMVIACFTSFLTIALFPWVIVAAAVGACSVVCVFHVSCILSCVLGVSCVPCVIIAQDIENT